MCVFVCVCCFPATHPLVSRSARLGPQVFSCASCDERASCQVNRAAVNYRSSYFYGAPIVVETEFANRLQLIDEAALRCEVFIHVRSSHPTPLLPGTKVHVQFLPCTAQTRKL